MSDDPALPVGDEGMRPAEPMGYVVGASDVVPGVSVVDLPPPRQWQPAHPAPRSPGVDARATRRST